MQKCIIFARVSTSKQEVDSQLKETQEYAASLGFDEFIPVYRVGASAYKVSQLYKELLNEMKAKILHHKEIKAVVCWHLNRLCRNDVVAMQLKEFFIENRVQLHIKEPTLTLLNGDGTVNSGAELAFSLFATMSKQQAKELKEKSRRAKARDKAVQKFLGGPVRFGYRVGEDKQVVPDETTAKIVREIYNMYSTGKWSYQSLLIEINQRYGLDFKRDNFFKIFQTTKYFDGENYPPIISAELWKKCEDVRKQCTSRPTNYKRFTFANRLIKCPICGKGYTGNVKVYSCVIHSGQHVSIKHLDGLLWEIAAHLEMERIKNEGDDKEILEKIQVLKDKLQTAEKETERLEKRRKKINDLFINDAITKAEHAEKLQQIKAEKIDNENNIKNWELEIEDYERIIKEDKNTFAKTLKIIDNISEKTEKEMRDIVRKWVKSVTFDGEMFTINTIARTYKCIYKRYKDIKWWTLGGNPLIIRPIERNNGECRLMEPHKKLNANHLAAHLSWLSGSEIV